MKNLNIGVCDVAPEKGRIGSDRSHDSNVQKSIVLNSLFSGLKSSSAIRSKVVFVEVDNLNVLIKIFHVFLITEIIKAHSSVQRDK